MMERPKFTKEQEQWICSKITEWYIFWKDRIAPENKELSSIAIDFLKAVVCNDTTYLDKIDGMYPMKNKNKDPK